MCATRFHSVCPMIDSPIFGFANAYGLKKQGFGQLLTDRSSLYVLPMTGLVVWRTLFKNRLRNLAYPGSPPPPEVHGAMETKKVNKEGTLLPGKQTAVDQNSAARRGKQSTNSARTSWMPAPALPCSSEARDSCPYHTGRSRCWEQDCLLWGQELEPKVGRPR